MLCLLADCALHALFAPLPPALLPLAPCALCFDPPPCDKPLDTAFATVKHVAITPKQEDILWRCFRPIYRRIPLSAEVLSHKIIAQSTEGDRVVVEELCDKHMARRSGRKSANNAHNDELLIKFFNGHCLWTMRLNAAHTLFNVNSERSELFAFLQLKRKEGGVLIEARLSFGLNMVPQE
jgi:hypothetical protein